MTTAPYGGSPLLSMVRVTAVMAATPVDGLDKDSRRLTQSKFKLVAIVSSPGTSSQLCLLERNLGAPVTTRRRKYLHSGNNCHGKVKLYIFDNGEINGLDPELFNFRGEDTEAFTGNWRENVDRT